MLIFGASGDLTRRLLLPALYNLACDGLLSEHFAIIGTSRRSMTSDEFRSHMSSKEQGIGRFHTRKDFDQNAWDTLANRLHYVAGDINDLEHFKTLRNTVAQLDAEYQTNGNILFYLATAPGLFGTICDKLYQADFQAGSGWKRIVVEKPFGSDLASAQKLNKQIHAHWDESQIYRIDHYLGKETVQNLLAFRFSNGMFEPLWNSNYIDNIQFSVCESVDVEGRGEYYDSAGVLRDMMQNHICSRCLPICAWNHPGRWIRIPFEMKKPSCWNQSTFISRMKCRNT
jgi:glucose-6-phosphate 1-dehydrogenase